MGVVWDILQFWIGLAVCLILKQTIYDDIAFIKVNRIGSINKNTGIDSWEENINYAQIMHSHVSVCIIRLCIMHAVYYSVCFWLPGFIN